MGALSFPNPEYVSRKNLGLYLDNTPKQLSCMQRVGPHICIPRGAVDHLKRSAANMIRFHDDRVCLPTIAMASSVTLRTLSGAGGESIGTSAPGTGGYSHRWR